MKGRTAEGDKETNAPFAIHCPRVCNSQGWVRMKAGTQNSMWVSHVSGRGSSNVPLIIICCLPRKWIEKQGSQDSNLHSKTGCQKWVNHLCSLKSFLYFSVLCILEQKHNKLNKAKCFRKRKEVLKASEQCVGLMANFVNIHYLSLKPSADTC